MEEYSFKKLTTLRVLVSFNLGPETRASGTDLLAYIAKSCRSLKELEVIFQFVEDVLDYDAIRPIVLGLQLRKLVISHTVPLRLSEDDAISLAKALGPNIRHLELNPSPLTTVLHLHPAINPDALTPLLPVVPPLPLSVLGHFAKSCPDLSHIGLYVEVTATPPPVKEDLRLPAVFFGLSPIESALSAISFLCHFNCPRVQMAKFPGRQLERVREYEGRWERVVSVMSVLHKVPFSKNEAVREKLEHLKQKVLEGTDVLDEIIEVGRAL
jgi:hypothetical protein